MKPTEQVVKDAADLSIKGMEKSFDGIEISVAHTGFMQGANWAISQMQQEWVPVTETSKIPDSYTEYWVCSRKKRIVSKYYLESNSNHHDQMSWRKRFSHYAKIVTPQPPTK